MKLDELLGLPKSGVVILTKQGQSLVTYTVSMGAYLETLYQQFGGKTGMELEIRSPGADLETLKLHTEYYREQYIKQGKLLQSHVRKAVKYKVRSVVSPDIKRVVVEIVNMRGEGLTVGLFRTIKEASEFMGTYYGADNSFVFPVYATNSDTKEFLLKQQKKLLDIR